MNLLNKYLLLLCSASNAGKGHTPEYLAFTHHFHEFWDKLNYVEKEITTEFFTVLFSKYVWNT